MTCPWYITRTAVDDYVRLTRKASEVDNATWEACEDELMRESELAHRVMGEDGQPRSLDSGAQLWRGGKPLRLQFVVSTEPHPNGQLPQLVRVLGSHRRERKT